MRDLFDASQVMKGLHPLRILLDCYPCFVRQALEAARMVTDDPLVQSQVLRRVCGMCAEPDLGDSPPAMAQRIHRIIRQVTGDSDPYRRIKQRFNRHAIALRDQLRSRVAKAENPFGAAVRLAIAGNCIDFGVHSDLTEQQVTAIVERAMDQPLNGQVTALLEAIEQARQILFLADNAGEIALDMLLIEQMPREKITVAVRGGSVINDATLEDAQAVGLTEWVTVIDNGSDAPGTLLEDCSQTFRYAFDRADVIISKGQGNYESLSGLNGHNIYYLLIPKCRLIADHIGCPQGSLVVRSAKEIKT